MTRPIMPDDGPPQTRPVVDAKQLWVGGIFTAIVAALVALLGVLVCRWLFNIPLLSPQSQGTYGDAHTTDVVLVAAAAALVATGLAHLLLVAAPRPMIVMLDARSGKGGSAFFSGARCARSSRPEGDAATAASAQLDIKPDVSGSCVRHRHRA